MSTTADKIQANLIALGFTNTSVLALYNKIAQAVGVTVDNTISEIQNSETIITNLLISQYGYGKPLYYVQSALNFQYGDNLIVNMEINPVTGQPYLDLIYATVDTTKKIIKQAAFESSSASGTVLLFLKVATLNTVSGLLVKLSDVQYTAFVNYFLNFEIPGLQITIISADANILGFNGVCTYFSTYDFPTLQANLNAALETFRNDFEFNGEFFSGDLQDYIKQNVPGVRDFFVNATTLDAVAFAGSKRLSSGYFDYAPGIEDNISYTAIT